MTSGGRTTIEESDRHMIDGLRKNDREAIAAVFDAYGGIAYGMAVRALGRSADAEDVVQESFLALWQQAARLDETKGIRSYLLTIVHHKAVDRLRRLGRRPELLLDPEAPLASKDESPEEFATRSFERQRLTSAMAGLPDEQRRAIELTYFGGLTINEAAQRMGVPLGTAKSRLRLALTHLRGQLQP